MNFRQTVLCLGGSAVVSVLMAHSVLAGGGTSVGGGGDACERRIGEIRADILKWIDDGGAKGLTLPGGVTLDAYTAAMSAELVAPPDAHAVVIGCVSTEQENLEKQKPSPDPELIVSVDDQPKTCRGFESIKDHRNHILCNIERFAADKTPPAEQYRLVHHEFAGLAGMEHNVGAASDYTISDQLTDFLVPETLLRLSVTRRHSDVSPGTCTGKCKPEDFAGYYELLSAGGNSVCDKTLLTSISANGVYFRLEAQLPDSVSVGNELYYGIKAPASYRVRHEQAGGWSGLDDTSLWVESHDQSLVLKTKYSFSTGMLWWTRHHDIYSKVELTLYSDNSLRATYYFWTTKDAFAVAADCAYTKRPN